MAVEGTVTRGDVPVCPDTADFMLGRHFVRFGKFYTPRQASRRFCNKKTSAWHRKRASATDCPPQPPVERLIERHAANLIAGHIEAGTLELLAALVVKWAPRTGEVSPDGAAMLARQVLGLSDTEQDGYKQDYELIDVLVSVVWLRLVLHVKHGGAEYVAMLERYGYVPLHRIGELYALTIPRLLTVLRLLMALDVFSPFVGFTGTDPPPDISPTVTVLCVSCLIVAGAPQFPPLVASSICSAAICGYEA